MNKSPLPRTRFRCRLDCRRPIQYLTRYTMREKFGILRFKEQYFERIWGGRRLGTLFGKPIPSDKPIGEAWLISDHPSAVSVVSEGPHAGKSLHDLIQQDAEALLGPRTRLTPQGRFPLLLKLLDSTDVLSVQVHPDDATAAALGEPDCGKTEMWHILHAEPGAELFCGLREGTTPSQMRQAINGGDLEQYLKRFTVKPGDSVFVEAGTVHAIGKGIVLAEIQQNSDLTYRLYDWNRVDAHGKRRELHIEKGLRATSFLSDSNSCVKLTKDTPQNSEYGLQLASSQYFSAYRCNVDVSKSFLTNSLFHIILSISSNISVSSETNIARLEMGESCLIPACIKSFTLSGPGSALLYHQ